MWLEGIIAVVSILTGSCVVVHSASYSIQTWLSEQMKDLPSLQKQPPPSLILTGPLHLQLSRALERYNCSRAPPSLWKWPSCVFCTLALKMCELRGGVSWGATPCLRNLAPSSTAECSWIWERGPGLLQVIGVVRGPPLHVCVTMMSKC